MMKRFLITKKAIKQTCFFIKADYKVLFVRFTNMLLLSSWWKSCSNGKQKE